MIEAPDIQLLL